MHPEISLLPSRVFYDGRLEDGPDMAEKTRQDWHSDAKFGVYKFFNVHHGREESSRTSNGPVPLARWLTISLKIMNRHNRTTCTCGKITVGIQWWGATKAFQLENYYNPAWVDWLDSPLSSSCDALSRSTILLLPRVRGLFVARPFDGLSAS